MHGTPARAGRHPLSGLLVRSALIGGAIAAVATPFAQSRAWFRSDHRPIHRRSAPPGMAGEAEETPGRAPRRGRFFASSRFMTQSL
jgi:hypothetical protein